LSGWADLAEGQVECLVETERATGSELTLELVPAKDLSDASEAVDKRLPLT
jgi:hypothetical protein